MLKKWIRRLKVLVITLMVLVAAILGGIRLPSVQTWLAQTASRMLSDDLGTEVSVGGVQIDLWARLVIKDIFVADEHGDTLAFISSLHVRSYAFDRSSGRISIREADLNKPYFRLYWYEGEEHMNLHFLTSYFASSDTTSSPISVSLRNFRIRDGSFRYHNENRAFAEGGVDWNHLHIRNIHLDIENLAMERDSLLATIDDLTFLEKSGFDVRRFAANVKVVPGEVTFNDAIIATPRSHIRGDLAFQLNSIEDLDYFEERVGMYHDLSESVVELGDIGYFTSSLRGIQKSVTVSGRFKGKVSNLRGRDVWVKVDENTWFKGAFRMDGLPDIDQTFITCDIEDLAFNKQELERIPVPPFDSVAFLRLPENIGELGQMNFSGNFTGFINDFVAYGDLRTEIGAIHSDISLRRDSLLSDYVYSGTFGSQDFDLGRFIGDPNIGKLTSELSVEGKGLTMESMDATLEGLIVSVGINNYTFRNIQADGTFRKRFFDGLCRIDDPNLVVDFTGQVDFEEKEPEMHFAANIYHMDLRALGILTDLPYSVLSCNLVVNSRGFDLDKFSGVIDVSDLSYCSDQKEYFVDHFRVEALRGDRPRIEVTSDIVRANIEGQFSVKELGASFQDILANVIPSYQPAIRDHRTQAFVLTLEILDFTDVSEVFIPELKIAPFTRLKLAVDEPLADLIINLTSDSISYEGNKLHRVVLDARRPDASLYFTLTSDSLILGGLTVPEFVVDAHSEEDTVYTDIAWGTADEIHQGDVTGKLTIRGTQNLDFDFGNGKIRINDSSWNFNPSARISLDNREVAIHDFRIQNGVQRIALNGFISEDPMKVLLVDINAFDLEMINPFIGDGTKLEGILTSSSAVRDVYHQLISNNDVNLIAFGVNDYLIGDICVESLWEHELRRLRIDGELQKDKLVPLHFAGYYTPRNEESPLDLTATVNDLDLSFIGAFLDKEVLGIRGFATGTLAITGRVEHPLMEGEALLRDAWIDVPYTNCSYQILQRVGILPDMFTFNHIPIRDSEGAPGFVTGQVIHNNFGDWSYDLVAELDKPFLVMNTAEELNSLYYGMAHATGTISIYGYEDVIEFDINAKTEKGTRFAMPMNSSEEQTFGSFIRFTDKDKVEIEEPLDLTGISLNFELDITPDAEFQIIFDEAVGDVMKGRGKGHLNLSINNLSTFNMYGVVELVSGDYLFTLKNLLNKEFTVTPGGTISWFGDPFGAELDLDAIYKVSASLYDIMPDATTPTGQRVPVDLIMHLSGKMMNPGINFDVRLPTVDELTRSRVESIISTDQERNRQAFSLLVLRRFIAPPNITTDRTGTNALAENSTELLSSQISNWLSQISDDFNLGFNYRPGDDISNEEIALALSTQLFNERLAISGNFGVSRGNEANQNPTNYIGDIRIEYMITREGRIRLVVYNESNDYRQITTQQSPYTQGVGVLYQEEFDTWDQLMCGFRQLFRSKNKRIECI